MFRCNDCEEIFDEPKYVKENRGEFWGVPCYETMSYCPYCGSEDYFEYREDEAEEDEQC